MPNYFLGDKRQLLVSPEGAQLDSAVIGALTGFVEYAQASGNPSAKVAGHVAKMTGSASIVRNGVAVDVQVGDTIYQSDVVQTGSRSTLGLVLNDGTAFNLSANARLMLNDLTFDANSTSNSSFITLVEGAASFVAGQVAKKGDMKVATPSSVIGIRGTAVKTRHRFCRRQSGYFGYRSTGRTGSFSSSIQVCTGRWRRVTTRSYMQCRRSDWNSL